MLRKIRHTVYPKRLTKSFLFALKGLVYIVKNHHNAQLIFFFAILAVIVGVCLRVPTSEMLIVLLTIGLVFVSEIFNTMIEDITNLITDKKFHPSVEVIKDMSAGAVLVASILSLVVGYSVFIKRLF